MMYRMSYRDLQWEAVFLDPCRYTESDGARIQMKTSEALNDLVSFMPERGRASIGMPAGRGKISDAGYDQMACLTAEIPAYDHVRFSACVRVLEYPFAGEQNGQEGLGLFLRDTMATDPLNGYPYSNMAAAGVHHGQCSLFGRQGITEDSIENVRNFSCTDDTAFSSSCIGRKMEIAVEKQDTRLFAEIAMEGASAAARFETTVDEGAFSSRDTKNMALGFMAARGCRMEVDLETVSIEYLDPAESGASAPVLYASPEGTDSAAGSQEDPLDIQSAVDRCRRGQEIRVLPGHYQMTKDLVISRENSGSSLYPKKMRIETASGEGAVLDFGGRKAGFLLEGNHWEIRGLTVTRGFGFQIRGSHNRIRECRAVSNLETGFLIRHPETDSPRGRWPYNNKIEDCDSFLNMDDSQQNADGFACKIAAGSGNAFIRCRAWMNSDDGFDLFSKNRSIGAVSLRGCSSWLNGFTMQGGELIKTRGNGNGFKLGGSGMAADHEAAGCEAIGNRGFGFTSNSNPHMRLQDCRAGNNQENYKFYYTGPESQVIHVTDNCREIDDPAFDSAAQANRLDRLGKRSSNQEHNEEVIHNTVKMARALYAEGEEKLPGLMILCSSFYGGGAERVACRLASGLAERYSVYYLYIQDKGQSYIMDPRVQTIQMPFFRGDWDVIDACRAEVVRELKEALDIEIAISFMYTMNKANIQSGGGAKVICSERNNPMGRYPQRMQEIDDLYAAADHVVFQSERVRGMFSDRVRSHGSIILNPVEVSCEKTESKHRIVNMGRLVPQKNQAMLIRAFADFYQNHRDHTLSFYGTGELAEELQTLADSLGAGEAVQFHGQVWDVHAAIADAEMFVLSSDYEGLSNALLESMMMGLPCISTRCEGSVDVIRPGENGILVDVGSQEQMTIAMEQLADDAALRERLGNGARKSSDSFRTGPVLEQWFRLIDTLPDD